MRFLVRFLLVLIGTSGNLFDGMEAHRASTIGGSIDGVIMNYHEVLFAGGVVYGMDIEFDALTSHVQSFAKTGQRIFRRESGSAAVPNNQKL